MRLLPLICLLIPMAQASGQFLVLSEYAYDESGSLDWLEVYNPEFDAVTISGWYFGVSGSLEPLPEFQVEAESYGLIYPTQEIKIASGIRADESQLLLEMRNQNGGLIGTLPLRCLPEGYSFGQEESGAYHYPEPSPEAENAGGVVFETSVHTLSTPSGFYADPVEVALADQSETEVIWRYTLDGQPLNLESPAWPETGLLLNDDNVNATELSFIPASDEYIDPLGEQDRGHTVLIQGFEAGCPVSPLHRYAYFIGYPESPYNNLDIVSLSLLDDDLFGEKGIYAFGDGYINFAYRGREWERPATLSYFSGTGDLLLEQDVGLRIRGNSSRFAPQKSFKIYARNSYGVGWMQNVFHPESGVEELKRVNLRAIHNDFVRSMLTDHLGMKAVENLSIDAPDSKPVVLFLNGEFWGLYFLQEAMDDYYPESHYGINDNDVVLMEHESDEVFPYFDALVNYSASHDLSDPEHFAWIDERVDLPTMIDYFAAQILIANWDWPTKNIKSWYSEGQSKLRFMFYDCDACWNDFDGSGLERFYPEETDIYEGLLFSRLMKNSGFRTSFALHVLDMFQGDFSPSAWVEMLATERERVEPLVVPHIARWGYPQTPEAWLNSVESIQLFCVRRQAAILDMLDLLLEDEFLLYPNPAKSGETVKISTLSGWDEIIPFVVYDSMGRTVQEGRGGVDGISLDHLPSGTYMVRMQLGTFLRTQPIVIVP